MVIRTRTS